MSVNRIAAFHTVTKKLGNWTTEREFEVRAARGSVVLDLRSPEIEDGDIVIELDADHAMIKLLVAEDAVIDEWDLRRIGRGRVKDSAGGAGGRRVVLTGQLRGAEVRVHRGGVAVLSAMCSREFLADAWQAHREGGFPTVADPARTA